MLAIQLVLSIYGNHEPRRNILHKLTLSTYKGSTNLVHVKPEQHP